MPRPDPGTFVDGDYFQSKRLMFLFTHFYEPPCFECKYFDEEAWTFYDIKRCDAFDEIPDEIWSDKNDHKNSYPGDRGIKFEEYL
ncbi:hypothetical protein TAGGR_2406 [Thermodesulfovibrio aggregans]|uniref:Uncharacterized protein n=1 Tax=Thermodesulfovibrio aggregans TaxID=86166 RepID=A0A0U9HR32_9BACT|nr:hypothetical protein [Thermodesulfovibrio aggregans]GAQ95511.1 hypothetical protein TAGGR_2406 [Thermodesulfovibrio aggregans]